MIFLACCTLYSTHLFAQTQIVLDCVRNTSVGIVDKTQQEKNTGLAGTHLKIFVDLAANTVSTSDGDNYVPGRVTSGPDPTSNDADNVDYVSLTPFAIVFGSKFTSNGAPTYSFSIDRQSGQFTDKQGDGYLRTETGVCSAATVERKF
jgi:hypothetical protein